MRMAQQVARLLELLFELGIGRELDSVALRGEWFDDTARAARREAIARRRPARVPFGRRRKLGGLGCCRR